MKKSLKMHQVDAFTNKLFSGNPAAVLVLNKWLPDETMLAIAQENNLSETAFTIAKSESEYDLRWFTPVYEVNFCGHATLATAHVLMTELAVKGPLTFHTRIGSLRVEKVSDGYLLDFPILAHEELDELPPALQNIFDTPPARLFKQRGNIFVELNSVAEVKNFIPDHEVIKKAGRVGLVITAKGDENSGADFVSRYFSPSEGIPEDPVTGSIHTTLVPYWAERLNKSTLIAYQASARGGWLNCELTDDRVLIIGEAVTYMEATIRLPE